jgi:serine/threonine-protein kinase
MVSYDFRDRYQSTSEVLQAIADIKSAKKWRLRKKFAIPLVLLAIILFIAVLATPQIREIFNPQKQYSSADTEFSIYENPSYSMRIKYPQSWKIQQIGDPFTGDVVKFWPRSIGSTKKLTAEVNINVENLKEPTSLVEYTNLSVNEIVQFLTNARIHDSHPTKLSNLPAHEVIYSGKEEGYNIKRMAIWTLKNHQVYIITYTAEESEYEQYLEIAQTMINSLTIY